MDISEVKEEILRALSSIESILENQLTYPINPEFILIGQTSPLDSLAVVSLLIALEENISEKLGSQIFITEFILGDVHSGYTLENLARTVLELIDAT